MSARDRALAVYLSIAFGLAWAMQLAFVFGLDALGLSPSVKPLAMLVAAPLLMWPPAVGAFVTRRYVEKTGFADSGLARFSWKHALLAAAFSPVVVLLTLLVSLPVYPFDPNFSFLRDALAQSPKPPPFSIGTLVAIQLAVGTFAAPLLNAPFALGEELGWRDYLLPRMVARFGPVPGLVGHGVIWGVWHWPIILGAGHNYPSHPLAGALLFVPFCVLLGVVFGWLQLASKSVWPPVLSHAGFNGIAAASLFLLKDVDTFWAGTPFSVLGTCVLGLVVVGLWRSGELARALATVADSAPPAAAGVTEAAARG